LRLWTGKRTTVQNDGIMIQKPSFFINILSPPNKVRLPPPRLPFPTHSYNRNPPPPHLSLPCHLHLSRTNAQSQPKPASLPPCVHPFPPPALRGVLYSTCVPFTPHADVLYISARWSGFVQPLIDAHTNADGPNADGHTEEDIPLPDQDTRMRLTRLFTPSLSAALDALVPRLVDAAAWARINVPPPHLHSQPSSFSLPTTDATPNSPTKSIGTSIQTHEGASLPRMAKFVLLAAFLASTNPAKSDVRMFSRAPEERKRARHRVGPRKVKGGAAKASCLPLYYLGSVLTMYYLFHSTFDYFLSVLSLMLLSL
jgi:Origin recognition complex (ORC) subunit 5 C-terminus